MSASSPISILSTLCVFLHYNYSCIFIKKQVNTLNNTCKDKHMICPWVITWSWIPEECQSAWITWTYGHARCSAKHMVNSNTGMKMFFWGKNKISHHHWVLPRALIWLYSITPLCTQNGWDPFTIHMMLCSRADTKHCSTSFSWERISTENVSTGWNVWGDKIIDMDPVLSEGRIFFYFHTKPKSPVIIIIIIIRLCQGEKTGKAAALSELK